nr:hypothetical protein [Clostridia bacterium]
THNYTDWTISKPPTCTQPGVEEGTCPDDGATTTRSVDPLGHDYGDWIIKVPTVMSFGKATKICANDSAHDHVIEVDLPALSTDIYTVKNLKETPTYVQSQYTFAHEEGDIVFVANATKHGISYTELSIEDAVTTAIDPYYSSLVGKVEGDNVTKTNRESKNPFLYELGENYVHVNTGDYEYWFDIDGEDVSGVVSDGTVYRFANENDADYLNGISFNNPFTGEKCYGAEELLDSLYASATAPADYNNAFYAEKANQHNGFYYFEWTVVESTFSDRVGTGNGNEVMTANTDTIYKAKVEFSLDINFMLSELHLSYDKYIYQYEVEETEEGSGIYVAKDELPYIYDKNDNSYEPNPGDEPDAHYEINVEQTALEQIGILPINPFEFDKITVSSFNMLAGGEVSKEEFDAVRDDDEEYVKEILTGWDVAYVVKKHFEAGETISITTAGQIKIYLADFAPDTAAEYATLNPVRVYLVPEDDEDILIAASDSWPYGTPITAVYSNDESYVLLKSRENVGDFTIKICVGDATKTFTLHVAEAAPEELVTNVNVYNDSKDSYDVKKIDNVTVYEGQNLTFEVAVGNFEDPYDIYTCDPSSTVTLKENYEGVSITEKDGVYTLTATKAGEYVINVVSKLDESVTTTLTVTVVEAPVVEDMLDGEYSAGDFTVTFNNGKVTISANEDVVAEFDCAYADGVLTANSSDNKFSIELTENYNLVLVYVDDFNKTNRAVLKVSGGAGEAVKEALVGTWSGRFDSYNMTVTFNDDSTVTFNDSMCSNVTLNYELTDNGDGTFSITFEDIDGDTYYDNYGAWFGLTANGSTVTFDGSAVTGLTIRVFDTASYDEGNFVATKN